MLPGIFVPTIFSGRSAIMTTSRFIRAMHPKTDIKPDRADVAKVLKAGWWGQLKIHGHRAQIHVPSDPHADVEAYNREGQRHAPALPPSAWPNLITASAPRHPLMASTRLSAIPSAR